MNSTKGKCEIVPELWLDYAEDLLEPALREDLSLHLGHCDGCLSQLKQFQAIRSSLSVKEDVLPDDEFFEQLEGKIMTKIAGQGGTGRGFHWQNLPQRSYLLMSLALVLLSLPLVWSLTSPKTVRSPSLIRFDAVDEWMVQTSENDIEWFNGVINGHEQAGDLIAGAAAARMAGMDDRQARKTLGL